MNKTIRIISLCLLISFQIKAQQKNGLQWESLFNGKDLKGWHSLNGHAKYEAINGELVGTTVLNEPNSFLATDKEYGDFILELEFKVDNSMNSGVQFRSESNATYMNGRVHGYQMEIDPSARAWSGGIYDEARRNWLYPLEYNLPAKKAFKRDQWNKYRIECIGTTLRTWVNGIPCAHLIDDMTMKGFIALQVHQVSKPEDAGKQIRFRNIRICTKNLQPSPYDNIFVSNLIPNNISAQEKKNGVRLLWDGVTSNGWRSVNKTTFPDKEWEIKDGILSVLGKNMGGDIVTTEKYGAIELQFEFRITDGANSGVKYFVTENENGQGVLGLEFQVLDDEKHPDAKLGSIGNRKQGSLYDLIPAIQLDAAKKKIGEWNSGRVVIYPDNKVEHWLNAYKVLDYQRGSQSFYALVAKSKFEKEKNFGMTPKGYILLQDHGNPVSFRSIKIKLLD